MNTIDERETDNLAHCLHEWIAARTRQSPDAIALLYEARGPTRMVAHDAHAALTLTYRELDKRSNQLAHYLVKLGIRPGARVGIYMERSADMIIGLLGILKTGAAYVLIEPSSLPQQLARLINYTKIMALLTETHFLSQLIVPDLVVVCIDQEWPNIGDNPSTFPPPVSISPAVLAYLVPLFERAGTYREVQVTHADAVRSLHIYNEGKRLETEAVAWVVATRPDHQVMTEVFLPLVMGKRVVIADYDPSLLPM